MLRFRAPPSQPTPGSTADLLAVSQVIDDAMQPGNFFAALPLSWLLARSETLPWEVFRGRLLDPAHTRETRTFLAWSVLHDEQPLLSVKLDVHARHLHVTRGMLCHVWEGYDTGGGVIGSRETTKWTIELVGSIALAEYANLDELGDELICLLWQAVIGTSRLPLTSLEAPLPGFVLGQLHYLYRPDAGDTPTHAWEDWLTRGLGSDCAWRETVKLLEGVLRHISVAQVPDLLRRLPADWPNWPRLMRAMFNDVSLSPYTGFVANAVALIEAIDRPDILGHLLRQLGYHLTAYDLVTFHHRGANYPDALLLDAVLKAYLRHLDKSPELFLGDDEASRLRRRALRHGVLLRRHYEGHLVPDAPTSPGENARVLPMSRVPEEQITHVLRRRRKLFDADPLTGLLSESARRVLQKNVVDLADAQERAELGMGVFIDRPLGYTKPVGEPDQTPLLAHRAHSETLVRRRYDELQRLCRELDLDSVPLANVATGTAGLPHAELADCPRPVAALTDMRRVADDFVVVATLPVGLADCLRHFDWQALLERYELRFLAEGGVRHCVQVVGGRLLLTDQQGRRRLELLVDASQGFRTRAGVELPRAELLVVMAWDDKGTRHDLTSEPLQVGVS